MTTEILEPLISAGALLEQFDDVLVIDCRFTLGEPGAGFERYLEEHVAGASFLDVDADLSGEPGPGGRHPLPDPDRFTAAARRAGIRTDVPVVAYDDGMTGGAARLWWLLRHFGKSDVAVLDGGWRGWHGPTASGEEDIPAGDFVARPRFDDVVSREDVLAGLEKPGRILVDTRSPERYRGDHEPIDPVAGHIPGARNLPAGEAFPAPRDLVEAEDEIVAYCGSGVTATLVLLALAVAGRDDAKLYPGSWSEWVAHDLPVETGEPVAPPDAIHFG